MSVNSHVCLLAFVAGALNWQLWGLQLLACRMVARERGVTDMALATMGVFCLEVQRHSNAQALLLCKPKLLHRHDTRLRLPGTRHHS